MGSLHWWWSDDRLVSHNSTLDRYIHALKLNNWITNKWVLIFQLPFQTMEFAWMNEWMNGSSSPSVHAMPITRTFVRARKPTDKQNRSREEEHSFMNKYTGGTMMTVAEQAPTCFSGLPALPFRGSGTSLAWTTLRKIHQDSFERHVNQQQFQAGAASIPICYTIFCQSKTLVEAFWSGRLIDWNEGGLWKCSYIPSK